jgi:S-adenosylmethionine decarboxylase
MAKGTHLIADCSDVSRNVCLDDQKMLEVMADAARLAGATVISQVRYKFGQNSPPGFTCVVMLDESHISAHTYADLGLIALDVFTCGDTNPCKIVTEIGKHINLGDIQARIIERFIEGP